MKASRYREAFCAEREAKNEFFRQHGAGPGIYGAVRSGGSAFDHRAVYHVPREPGAKESLGGGKGGIRSGAGEGKAGTGEAAKAGGKAETPLIG